MTSKVIQGALVSSLFVFSLHAAPAIRSATCSAQRVAAKEPRSVVISSGITRKSQGYKKWGTHYPTSFKVSINDQLLESGRQKKFLVPGNKIRVKYEYSFLKGKIKGAKEITFALDPHQSQHTLTFSWDDPWRVQVSSANPIATKELYKKWM